jgi:hypothetical protein
MRASLCFYRERVKVNRWWLARILGLGLYWSFVRP